MNRLEVVLRVGLISGLLCAGCVEGIWEENVTSQYGRERSQQVCPPFGQCMQGIWVAGARVSEDTTEAYARCMEENLRRGNGWSKDTVSLGLEFNRCMVGRGFKLVQE